MWPLEALLFENSGKDFIQGGAPGRRTRPFKGAGPHPGCEPLLMLPWRRLPAPLRPLRARFTTEQFSIELSPLIGGFLLAF